MIKALSAFMGNMGNDHIATLDNQHQRSVNPASTQRQQSVNDFGCCNLCNASAVPVCHLPIIEVLGNFRVNMVRIDFTTLKTECH
jgi:hypothetical protein